MRKIRQQIDRQNIKKTFAELKLIEDFCTTFEVDFKGEVAKDYREPRMEWICLMNATMKEKYFDKDLKEYLVGECFYVGVTKDVPLLQNG